MPLDAVLPAFLIAVVGYVTGSRLDLDKRTLSRICLYVLTPALTFNSLATSTVDLAAAWKLSLATFLSPLILILVFFGLFKALRYDTKTSRALLLPTIFTNAGNYGLPVCLFAFGQQGMDLGAVFMVTQSVIIATAGVYIAASGRLSVKTSVKQVLRMPTVYAPLLGLCVKLSGIKMPAIVMRPVQLLADGAIGIFLFLLGLQLVGTVSQASLWKTVSVSVVLRLVAAPAIAMLLGNLIGLRGLPWKVLVLQSAMPPPVTSTILAQEFDARPEIISSSTLLGTVASVITLTLWIMALRAV